MTEPAEPSFKIERSPTRRIVIAVIALVAASTLAFGAYVIYMLATAEPGAAACERLDQLAQTDPAANRVVDQLVALVEHRVVRLGVVGQHPIEITGTTPDDRCHSAIDTLDHVMGHTPFMELVKCIATAPSAKVAMRCLP